MKLISNKSINLRYLAALSAAAFLMVNGIASCGDDDDDETGADASVAAGGKGGKGSLDASVATGGKGGASVNAGKGGGGSGGTAETVAVPTTTAECNTMMDESGEANQLSKCMCQNCLDGFAACMVDADCVEVMRCVNRTGCRGQYGKLGCTNENMCQKEIAYLTEYKLELALTLTSTDECKTKNCLPEETTDSGI